MHPIDSATPPSGEGWVIQLVCHHYNPYPNTKTKEGRAQMDMSVDDPRRTDFGPYQFLTEKVLEKLNSPSLRLFGVDHIALAWMAEDKEWTTEKGGQHNNLASKTVPLLIAQTPTVAESGGGAVGRNARRQGGNDGNDGHDGRKEGRGGGPGGGMPGGMGRMDGMMGGMPAACPAA